MVARHRFLFLTLALASALCVPQFAFATTDQSSADSSTVAGDAQTQDSSIVSEIAADGVEDTSASLATALLGESDGAQNEASSENASVSGEGVTSTDGAAIGGASSSDAGASTVEGGVTTDDGTMSDATSTEGAASGSAATDQAANNGDAPADATIDTAATTTTDATTATETATAATTVAATTAAAATTTKAAQRTSAVAPVIKTGWYNIVSSLNSSYSLYVKGQSTKNGAKLQLKKSKNAYGTVFCVKREGNYYRIYAGISTDKLLEVKSTKKGKKTTLTVDIRSKKSKASLFKLAYDESLGAYRLVNVTTGYVIGVSGSTAKDGASITAQKQKAGSSAQSFYFSERPGLVAANIYEIATKQKGKRALSASDSKGKFYSYTTDATQKWKVSLVPGKQNVYTIESLASGKLLTGVKNKTVQVNSTSSSNTATWWKASYKNGGIVWTNYKTKKPLSTAGKKCSQGSSAMNKKQSTTSARVFTMKAVPVLESGIYMLQSNANAGYVVTVPDSSKTSGAAIQLKASTTGNNQKWRYDATAQTFTNVNSGLVLTSSAVSVGAGITQTTANGSATQKWCVEYAGGGKYRLVSYANKSLAVTGAAASDGAAVQLQTNVDSKLQKFNVAKASITYSPKGFKLIKSIVNWGHGSLKASYIVIHETANPGATAKNHRDYWANSGDYAVHYTLDWTGDCYYCVPEDRKCWQVGNGNQYVVGIELCHATNKSDFTKVWNAGVQWAAWQLKKNGWGIDRLLSHNDCRKKWGGTDHADPDSYFASYGKSWNQFKSAVAAALASY